MSRRVVSPLAVCPNYERDELFDDFAIETLRDRYMIPGETSPQHALARACAAFADDEAHARRLYGYVSQHWFMFATPLLSNGGTTRGLPISCFLNYVPDTREGILGHYVENGWLSSMGGGIGSYWGALRGKGEKTSSGNKTTGVIPFAKVVDSQMLAFNQGSTRRGSAAVYLDISHPEVEEWIIMRKETGGDANRKTPNLHNALNVSDAFMQAVSADAPWDLIDPKSKRVTKTLQARHIWQQIIDARKETGEPYLFFIDTANKALPQPLKDIGLKIYSSNLCTEITLPTGPDPRDGLMRTAVCCLSSTNLATYNQWKNHPRFIEDVMRMLDNALEAFIQDAGPEHAAAVRSATRERSVGLGAMGFHSYLQANSIPLESAQARSINRKMFQHLHDQTLAASLVLGAERGSPQDMEGTGHRFAHRMAIAPNATSSILCGNVSPGVEPRPNNAYLQKTLSGSSAMKNHELEQALEKYGMNTDATWSRILKAKGSVQDIVELPEVVRATFKTTFEIDQLVLVRLAADRQPFIDQAQSINLFFPKDATAKELHDAHFAAWAWGLKSLYYLRSETMKRANLMELETTRRVVVSSEPETCLACEG